jgi:hypothetical protein
MRQDRNWGRGAECTNSVEFLNKISSLYEFFFVLLKEIYNFAS